MYSNLRSYLQLLESENELVRITAPVDPVLEIAEITDRMSKSPGGGKALLFERTGTPFPVATNLFGSDRRIALALGARSLEEIPARIDTLLSEALAPRERLSDKLRLLPMLVGASRWMPRPVRGRGACQHTVLLGDAARLSLLPVLQCWPADGGRFVTLPLVHTLDPETGMRNVGMYRMQVMDDHTTGMHWHIHKTGARHYEAYRRRGERMPVSVCIGGDPAYTYAATAPLPDGVDEYLLAGFLRGRPVRLVKCLTNDLRVPEDCDFVLEGYVDPSEEKTVEGPFGDHTGFYSLEDLYPRFHLTAITHRKDAVYPATIVGIPPQEDAYIAKATERIFLAPIRMALQPEIHDLYMPPAGVAHNLALVSLEIHYPGQSRKVASSLWGAGQMMFNKFMLLAPAGTDLRDPQQVARLVRGARIPRDLIRSEGVLDVLDHATPTCGFGGKLALDCTSEEVRAEPLRLPEHFTGGFGIASYDPSLAEVWRTLLLFAEPDAEADAAAFLRVNNVEGVKFVILLDPAAAGLTAEEILWLAAGNISPERDAVVDGNRLILDARTKLPAGDRFPARFPNPVVSAEATVTLVDGRWREYGLGEFLPSPSDRYRRLCRSEKAEI